MAEGAGLNEAFGLVYKIAVILSILAFFIITALCAIDVYAYVRDEVKQKSKLILDPNMPNKDTTDVNAFKYLNASADNEPYNIYLVQKIVNGVYTMIGLVVIVFAIQVASFFGFKIYSMVNETPFKETIDLPIINLAVLVIVFIGIVIFNYTYKHTFLQITQPSMDTLRKRMRDIKKYIYGNLELGEDSKFANALAGNDMDTIINIIKEKLADDDGSGTSSSAMDAARMIFTLNLYTYYQYEIPEGDVVWDDLRGLFTPSGVQNQTIDPTLFFYYKKPIYVTNMYPSLRKDIAPLLGEGERPFVREISKMMRQLNLRLSRLQEISGGKTKLFDYLKKVFIIALIFLIIVTVIYFEKYSYLLLAWAWLMSKFSKEQHN